MLFYGVCRVVQGLYYLVKTSCGLGYRVLKVLHGLERIDETVPRFYYRGVW